MQQEVKWMTTKKDWNNYEWMGIRQDVLFWGPKQLNKYKGRLKK